MVCCFVGGSRGISMETEDSDIDVVILTEPNKSFVTKYALSTIVYEGARAHAYIYPVNYLVSFILNDLSIGDNLLIGCGLIDFMSSSYILEKENYLPLINFLIDNKKELLRAGIRNFFDCQMSKILTIINKKKVLGFYQKHYYYLIYAYDKLNGTDNRELSIKIKTHDQLSKKDEEAVINILQWEYDWYLKNYYQPVLGQLEVINGNI